MVRAWLGLVLVRLVLVPRPVARQQVSAASAEAWQ
jgi:hypothetical protein